jgi:hypothetical protein
MEQPLVHTHQRTIVVVFTNNNNCPGRKICVSGKLTSLQVILYGQDWPEIASQRI